MKTFLQKNLIHIYDFWAIHNIWHENRIENFQVFLFWFDKKKLETTLRFFFVNIVAIIYHNDELSSSLTWLDCLQINWEDFILLYFCMINDLVWQFSSSRCKNYKEFWQSSKCVGAIMTVQILRASFFQILIARKPMTSFFFFSFLTVSIFFFFFQCRGVIRIKT